MWNKDFIWVCASTLFFFMGVYFVTTLLPLYMKEIGYNEGTIGWIFGLGALAALFGRILSGWAIEAWGTRWFLITGALVWAVLTPFMAVMSGLVLLMVCRLLQGIGLAAFMNASLGHVAYITPQEIRCVCLL